MERGRVLSIGFVACAALILFCFPLYYSYIIPSEYHGLRLDSSVSRPSFELADLNQTPVRLTDLKGSYLYVFFGYSKCNGICPRALGQLYAFARAATQTATATASSTPGTQIPDEKPDRSNPAENFRVLFLSIDPARDDPPHLRAFFSDFGRQFLALRDGREQVAEVARRFGIQYSLPAGDATDYQIDHPELVYVIDPDGTPVLLYTDVNSKELLADWRRLQQTSE